MSKGDTKADFITAFWKLYEKKEIDKISISDICKVAGYNRTTFYVYYENIYDLLNKAVEDIFIPLQENVISILGLNRILDQNAVENIYFNIFKEKGKYIEILSKRQHYYIFNEKIKTNFISLIRERVKNVQIEDTQDLEYLLEYQISAILGVMRYWFQSGRQLPENELIEMIYNISSKGILTVIRKEVLEINFHT